jgi:hypothetical protein
MLKIALCGFLAKYVFENGMCMLNLEHVVEHIPRLPDLLSFYMNFHWSNYSTCGLARGVSRDG